MPAETGTPLLLRAAADHIERLEQELAVAREQNTAQIVEHADAMRALYRRGYYAGHRAGAAGRARETSPERHTRGELGQRLRHPSDLGKAA